MRGDAQTRIALAFPLTNGPMDRRYRGLLFPDDGVGTSPSIRDIHVHSHIKGRS